MTETLNRAPSGSAVTAPSTASGTGGRLARAARSRPIAAAFVLLAITFALRVNDIFVLRIDELWGEIIISKGLGFLLILAFLLVLRARPAMIGLHSRHLGRRLAFGAVLSLGIYAVAYATEFAVLGGEHALSFAAIDSKQGVDGGLVFAGFLVLGNVVNALMEEGLFRGLFLPALMTRLPFWKANLVQAALFGVWHLVWPLKSYLTGESSAMGAVFQGSMLLLGSFINGVFWGYLFYRTDSLWAPVSAHVLANSILNLVHLGSSQGLDGMIMVRSLVAGTLGLVAIAVVAVVARRADLPRLVPLAATVGSHQAGARVGP